MITLEPGLVAYVAAHYPDYQQKLFPTKPPGNASRPHITYRQISKPGDPTLSGPCALQEIRIQFDFWGGMKQEAEGFGFARQAADRFRELLDGIGHVQLSNGCCLHASWFEDERVESDDDTELHHIQQDYLMHYYI